MIARAESSVFWHGITPAITAIRTETEVPPRTIVLRQFRRLPQSIPSYVFVLTTSQKDYDMGSLIHYHNILKYFSWGPPGVLGIWGERLFIFRELGSTASYFRGAGEQAHTFGDLGSTAKK